MSQKKFVSNRETREGWPLLTVETGANGDLWTTNGWPIGLVVLVRDFYPALATLVSQVKKIPHRTLFHFICPHRPGQAVVPCRLSLNMCLWSVIW
jgi:hypothetical protein